MYELNDSETKSNIEELDIDDDIVIPKFKRKATKNVRKLPNEKYSPPVPIVMVIKDEESESKMNKQNEVNINRQINDNKFI